MRRSFVRPVTHPAAGRIFRGLAVMVVAAVLSTPLARSEDCVDHGEYLHRAGTVDGFPSYYYRMALAGDHAYVLGYWDDGEELPLWLQFELHVIDLSSPESPRIVGTTSAGPGSNDLAAAGDYAYVTGLGQVCLRD